MNPEMAREKREEVIRDGYCVIDDILSEDFLQELRDESERLIDVHTPLPELVYQGQHVMKTVAHLKTNQKVMKKNVDT